MSAYSEWKAGMITDAEYATICKREYYEEKMARWDEGHDWDEEDEFEDDDIDEYQLFFV